MSEDTATVLSLKTAKASDDKINPDSVEITDADIKAVRSPTSQASVDSNELATRSTTSTDDLTAPRYIEWDPKHRYGKFAEVLGRGSSKVVHRAFDTENGMEVAWNEISLESIPSHVRDKLKYEVELLLSLSHPAILECYAYWVNEDHKHLVFITELMTSGTLKQFIRKSQHIKLKVLKKWAVTILEGLAYLHSRNPPIIHRDIKCDNIFINGHTGTVKIGDMGLATSRFQTHVASVLGTPEFMAPELFEEKYDEKVDVYAFGMCILEMVTRDYPYSECQNAAQIFKKVMAGVPPHGLSRVIEPTIVQIIQTCLAPADKRPTAKELLRNPFFDIDDEKEDRLVEAVREKDEVDDKEHPVQPSHQHHVLPPVEITLIGRKSKDEIELKMHLKIEDKWIDLQFPFHLTNDAPSTVAEEMAQDFELTLAYKNHIHRTLINFLQEVPEYEVKEPDLPPATPPKAEAKPQVLPTQAPTVPVDPPATAPRVVSPPASPQQTKVSTKSTTAAIDALVNVPHADAASGYSLPETSAAGDEFIYKTPPGDESLKVGRSPKSRQYYHQRPNGGSALFQVIAETPAKDDADVFDYISRHKITPRSMAGPSSWDSPTDFSKRMEMAKQASGEVSKSMSGKSENASQAPAKPAEFVQKPPEQPVDKTAVKSAALPFPPEKPPAVPVKGSLVATSTPQTGSDTAQPAATPVKEASPSPVGPGVPKPTPTQVQSGMPRDRSSNNLVAKSVEFVPNKLESTQSNPTLLTRTLSSDSLGNVTSASDSRLNTADGTRPQQLRVQSASADVRRSSVSESASKSELSDVHEDYILEEVSMSAEDKKELDALLRKQEEERKLFLEKKRLASQTQQAIDTAPRQRGNSSASATPPDGGERSLPTPLSALPTEQPGRFETLEPMEDVRGGGSRPVTPSSKPVQPVAQTAVPARPVVPSQPTVVSPTTNVQTQPTRTVPPVAQPQPVPAPVVLQPVKVNSAPQATTAQPPVKPPVQVPPTTGVAPAPVRTPTATQAAPPAVVVPVPPTTGQNTSAQPAVNSTVTPVLQPTTVTPVLQPTKAQSTSSTTSSDSPMKRCDSNPGSAAPMLNAPTSGDEKTLRKLKEKEEGQKKLKEIEDKLLAELSRGPSTSTTPSSGTVVMQGRVASGVFDLEGTRASDTNVPRNKSSEDLAWLINDKGSKF